MELAVQREMEDGATARAGAIAESNVRSAEASRPDSPDSQTEAFENEMQGYVSDGNYDAAFTLAVSAFGPDNAQAVVVQRFLRAGNIQAALPALGPYWNSSRGVEAEFIKQLTEIGVTPDQARAAYDALSAGG